MSESMRSRVMLRPLSEGDVLCNEGTGSVYVFKRFDTFGRIVVWDCRGAIQVIDPVPKDLWRYDREVQAELLI